MTYILVIWTVIAAGGPAPYHRQYDWRPIGEFHQDNYERKYTAKQMCEEAARQLDLKPETYRCVRNK